MALREGPAGECDAPGEWTRTGVTHDDKQPTTPETPATQAAHDEPVTGASIAGEPAAPNAEQAIEGDKTPPEPDTTVGTGTSIALGCIAGTIILIFIGLVFLGITALF